jgi:virginiamycin A acetyltransferase
MRFADAVAALRAGQLDLPGVSREGLRAFEHVLAPSIPADGYFFEPHSQLLSPIVLADGRRPTNLIGAYSYINGGGYLRDRVAIGRYCSIGRRVTIAAGNHSIRSLSTSPRIKGGASRPYTAEELARVYSPSPTEPFTVIESDVWIGDGAVIKAGVHLAVGSVVGANAVVVRDTQSYEIVGGVAARHLGFRFAPSVIDDLLATEWWERDAGALNRLPSANVFEFIERFHAEAPAPADFPLLRCGN